eukprot:1030982-Amphidinium_carterae.1
MSGKGQAGQGQATPGCGTARGMSASSLTAIHGCLLKGPPKKENGSIALSSVFCFVCWLHSHGRNTESSTFRRSVTLLCGGWGGESDMRDVNWGCNCVTP